MIIIKTACAKVSARAVFEYDQISVLLIMVSGRRVNARSPMSSILRGTSEFISVSESRLHDVYII